MGITWFEGEVRERKMFSRLWMVQVKTGERFTQKGNGRLVQKKNEHNFNNKSKQTKV